jgi:branched-chain amino acid transport system permease protein
VLGGLGNSFAAAVAGLVVGVLESFSIAVLPIAFKDVVSLGILLAILFLRPQGLFAPRPGRAAARARRAAGVGAR